MKYNSKLNDMTNTPSDAELDEEKMRAEILFDEYLYNQKILEDLQ